VLRRTLVPTQHLIHKLQTTHATTDSSKHFLSPLTVRRRLQLSSNVKNVVTFM
jgi:hypothetical protein